MTWQSQLNCSTSQRCTAIKPTDITNICKFIMKFHEWIAPFFNDQYWFRGYQLAEERVLASFCSASVIQTFQLPSDLFCFMICGDVSVKWCWSLVVTIISLEAGPKSCYCHSTGRKGKLLVLFCTWKTSMPNAEIKKRCWGKKNNKFDTFSDL